MLDRDPYLVISDGRLVWMQDAYTTSDALPYSQPVDASGINYIRNAVKIAVDAYDGTMRFYVADPTDPILRTYQRIFPSLFQPLDEHAGRRCASTCATRRISSSCRRACTAPTT